MTRKASVPQPPPVTNTVNNNRIFSSKKNAIYLLLVFVIVIGTASLLLPAIFDYIGQGGSENSTHLENFFVDIDGDGDQDFVERADVLLNCAGKLCQPASLPPTRTPAEPAEEPVTGLTSNQLDAGKIYTIFYSYFNPELGGANCSPPCDTTANGSKVADWWNKGAACPNDLPFGTVITLPGGEKLTCIDRFNQTHRTYLAGHPAYGELVSRMMPSGDAFWLDVLSRDSPVPYGTPLTVAVLLP
jgi:hypothetical protein